VEQCGEIELHTLHNTIYKMSGVRRRKALTIVRSDEYADGG